MAALVLTVPATVQLRRRWPELRRHGRRDLLRSARLVALYGVVAVALCQLCFFQAVERLSVGVALLLEYLGIVLVVLWQWVQHGQRPRPLTVTGSAAALVGLVLVLDLTGSHRLDPVGVLWGLGAAVGLAVFYLVSARTEEPLPPLAMAWAAMTVGALVLIAAAVAGVLPVHAAFVDVHIAGRTTSWLLPVLGLSLVAAVVSYVAGIGAARRLGARLASFVGLTEVLFAVLFAWLLLGQLPGGLQLAGGVLIVAGVALVRVDELRTPADEPAVGGGDDGGMTSKTWFITGASKGFGREWALAALERGDSVAATARDASTLVDLEEMFGDQVMAIQLDVTDRNAAFDAVRRAHAQLGRLDVVVNNAGYGQFGMVEELSEADARDQIETNLFGALWVTQAALPFMRAQRSGHLLQVSSIGGITAFPGIGMYHASKWALEGLSQALAGEVAGFGISVTIIEPTGYSTDWAGPSSRTATPLPAYDEFREENARRTAARRRRPGDPAATRGAILAVVDADEPPLRIFLGDGPLAIAEADYQSRLATWHEWEPVSVAAHGNPA